MGLLDITIGSEDQQVLIGTGMVIAGGVMMATGVGAAPGAMMMAGGAGVAAGGINAKETRRQQEEAIADQKAAVEKARYDSLLQQLSAEIQADQTVLATLSGGSNNTKKTPGSTGVNTEQNKVVGSSTSGTF